MRRTARALSLLLTAAAALAAVPAAGAADGKGDRTVSFSRSPATVQPAVAGTPSERIWVIVSGSSSIFGDEDDEDLAGPPELPTDLPTGEGAQLRLLQAAGVADGAGSLEDALAALELPFMFAGREQWVANLGGGDGAAADPRLWNVTMESILRDGNAQRLILGRAAWALEERTTMAADLAYWESLVPEWAPRVRDELAAEGIPFSIELLSSPDINLDDPAEPLFSRGAHPTSLFSLGVLQAGENAYLRGLSAEEVTSELWPLVWRYHHRPAGAPVPEGFEAGLTLGGAVRIACSEVVTNGCINGVKYRFSPVRSTDSYTRWVAYGTPGLDAAGSHNGYVVDAGIGMGYNPLTGAFFDTAGSAAVRDSQRRRWLSLMQSGALQPGHFITPWTEVVQAFLVNRISSAGYLGDPSIYFTGVYAPFAPDKLSADTRARLAAVAEAGES